ncbi:MAG: ATP-binding protein [Treponema sp.]|nr:ATP-binding protein [Treponema sp.]
MDYCKRLADSILKDMLEAKGAVLVEGAKWCGKTTTAEQISNSQLYMQDPAKKAQNLQLANLNPSLLLEGKTPRLIDEWQLAPKLWDAVRFEVDKRNVFNQFILTGSAVPASFDEISHSGTGRIARLLMRPMTLLETGDSTGKVSLQKLFQDDNGIAVTNESDLKRIAYLICRGGWPKVLGASEKIALRQAVDYYNGVVNSDVSRVDNKERNAERAKRLMYSYSRNIGTQIKYEELRKDAISNDIESFSIETLYDYINALKKIFVIEDAPAWNPNLRSKASIRTTDTRYFVDPSIATASLGLGPDDLLNDLQTMGFLFENLCIRDLRVYAQEIDGQVYHYRDRNNLECDAVVHLRNGRYGLVEIKLGGDSLIEEGAKTLKRLEKNLDTDKMKSPSFKMILTAVGDYAYKREDGILIVPVTCLGN